VGGRLERVLPRVLPVGLPKSKFFGLSEVLGHTSST